jgi:hypothetical protein
MKAYSKPMVSQIQLVMDQAVLSACKTSGTYAGYPGSTAVDCDHGLPGSLKDCYTKGS